MPAPASNILSSQALAMISDSGNSSNQRSLFSSVASGLWSVVTLGYGSGSSSSTTTSSSATTNLPSNKLDQTQNSQQIFSYLPDLPVDTNNSSNNTVNDVQIDCPSRLLAWQSCHLLLILTNHCTNESLYNPYRLALFHFTDTQGT